MFMGMFIPFLIRHRILGTVSRHDGCRNPASSKVLDLGKVHHINLDTGLEIQVPSRLRVLMDVDGCLNSVDLVLYKMLDSPSNGYGLVVSKF